MMHQNISECGISSRKTEHQLSERNTIQPTSSSSSSSSSSSVSSSSACEHIERIERKRHRRRVSKMYKNNIINKSAECVKNKTRTCSKWTFTSCYILSHCMSLLNNCIYNFRPLCYLWQSMAKCTRTWNGQNETSSNMSQLSIATVNDCNNSLIERSFKRFNRSSYFYSSLSSCLSSLFNIYSPLLSLMILISFILKIAEACSSRSTPKPRPPSPTTRPNITFQTYACPEAYAKWYCLNGATCFSVRIGESILYNCECADGYMGQRCEFKDLDGSYLPSREKVLVETASIAGGATIAVLLMVIISIFCYTYIRQRKKEKRLSADEIDFDQLERKPFSRSGSLRTPTTRHNLFNNNTYNSSSSNVQYTSPQDLECGHSLLHALRPQTTADYYQNYQNQSLNKNRSSS